MTPLKDLSAIVDPHTVLYILDNDGKELTYFAPHKEKSVHEQVCESEYADYEIVSIKAKTHCLHIKIDWLGLCVA